MVLNCVTQAGSRETAGGIEEGREQHHQGSEIGGAARRVVSALVLRFRFGSLRPIEIEHEQPNGR